MGEVTGHVLRVERKRGAKFYVKYRLPSGRQKMEILGPVWEGPGRPPDKHFTEKMAKAALEAKLTDARRGQIPDPGDRSGKTFADAVAEWLRYVEVDQDRRASTLRDYRNTAKGALLPDLGADTPLEKIDTERIEAYRSRLLDESELSRRSIQKRLVLLGGIFKRARKCGWISTNPVGEVEAVSVQQSDEFNVLTVDQVEAVVHEASSPMYAAAITVAAYTGLRTGEVRALRWGDVDFAGTQIVVRRNMPVGGEVGPPKSGKVRSTLLMEFAAAPLDALFTERGDFTSPDDLVFCSETGEMLGEDALRKQLYAALAAAGIDRKAFPAKHGFTFHDLRHTFGTLAAQKFPLVDVQAWMGHADIQTTMRYVHYVPKVTAAAEFARFVQGQRSGDRPSTEPSTEPTISSRNGAQLSATQTA